MEMWTSPPLIASVILVVAVAIILFIGIQIGVKQPWWRVRRESALVRYVIVVIIVISLSLLIALGVARGHADVVLDGALRGAWSGALGGAWIVTRLHHKRLNTVGEAFAEGLAETLDAVLVGAIVGAFLLSVD